MIARSQMWKIGAVALLAVAAAVLAACAVEGGGYGGTDVGVSYYGDFYEPFGYEYGGWGRGYRVGPPRGHGGGGGRAPSIPSGPRGGGGHGGGHR
jgi:predicted small secreted protein